MSSKYTNVNPKTQFLTSIFLLLATVGLMLGVASLGKCYHPTQTVWSSACRFGDGVVVTTGNIRLTTAQCDKIYDKRQWQKFPTIVYTKAVKGRRYTVLLLDGDVPDYPNGTYFVHMCQTNILGEDLKEGNFMTSLTLKTYSGPAPRMGTGLHKFMFVVYQHCHNNNIMTTTPKFSRIQFNLAQWVMSLPIKLVGPIAGVQFRAGYAYF